MIKNFVLPTLALLTVTAQAQNVSFRTLVEAKNASRAVVEVSSPAGLSYRVCRPRPVTESNVSQCESVGPDLPNTDEAKSLVQANFTAALTQSLDSYLATPSFGRLVFGSVFMGAVSVAVEHGLGRAFPARFGGPLTRKQIYRSLFVWSASFFAYDVVSNQFKNKSAKREIGPMTTVNGNPFAQPRALNVPAPLIFRQDSDEMDLIVSALAKTVKTLHAAYSPVQK